VADDDARCGARDARHVVVLGEPKPLVAEALDVLREVHAVGECLRVGRALYDVGKIEDGQRYHAVLLPRISRLGTSSRYVRPMLSTARLILRPFVLDDVRKVFAMSLEAGMRQ